MNSRWNSTEAYDLSLYEVPVQPVKRPQPAPAAKTSRAAAKKAKNYAEADRIRDELKSRGILLEDTPSGVRVVLA